MTKSKAAFLFASKTLGKQQLFFWTFTFKEVLAVKDTRKRWNHLLTLLLRRWPNLQGLRVFELHKEHGLHVHLLTNQFIDVNEARSLAERAGWGRIHVKRVATDHASYLGKYLSKERPECLKRWRLWAGFGAGWEWTKVKDVIRETLFSQIYRACKEWKQWQGRDKFFERMSLVRQMMILTIENGWEICRGPCGRTRCLRKKIFGVKVIGKACIGRGPFGTIGKTMQTRLVAKRTGRGLILLAALVQAHYGIATSMPMSLPTVGGTYEPTERILPIASTPILAPLPTPTPTPTPSVAPGLTRSLNISTRLFVGSAGASDVGIGGFIITGTTPREVLIRALGPSLPVGNGVVLPDPELELHGPAGFTTVTNNNWRETQEQQIIATGIPPIDDLESAILVTLDPGAYTAIVQGKGNVGVGLVEIYDLTQGGDSKLANLSTRGNVYRERDFLMIAGFILGGGTDNDLVIVRGLAPFDGGLIDPILELRNSQGALVCANDNWMDDPSQKAIIIAANLQPSNNLESAIAESLAPGAYTSVLSGVGIVTIWTGLIEVYDRPVVDYGSGAAHALFPLEGDF